MGAYPGHYGIYIKIIYMHTYITGRQKMTITVTKMSITMRAIIPTTVTVAVTSTGRPDKGEMGLVSCSVLVLTLGVDCMADVANVLDSI